MKEPVILNRLKRLIMMLLGMFLLAGIAACGLKRNLELPNGKNHASQSKPAPAPAPSAVPAPAPAPTPTPTPEPALDAPQPSGPSTIPNGM